MDLKLIFSHFMTGEKHRLPFWKSQNSSNLPDRSVPKDPAQSQTYRHYSKIPKLLPTTGKHQNYANKPQQNLKK